MQRNDTWFKFIQLESPTSVSGDECLLVFHSVGGKSRLNKVKASGGCYRVSKENYRAELDKIWAQIRQAHLFM
ncbi:hypothetical protein [Siminovitchia terrae]|uniref:hypothetical protein n=1 Tax=Siminovitchia terrae TaxID=1914933 RepID=UPI0028AA9687|nr:hypothetical protein [Siminovitchia terrae]